MVEETAMFGMGCFWSPDLRFSNLKGVNKVEVGFAGGKVKNPSYFRVSTHTTGHAEVVKIWFDPKKITYEKLLETFWKNHNPTTKNRQGFDIGSQYRSVIFYFNSNQKKLALESKEKAQKKLDKEIVTEIVRATKFYKAEEHHQDYLRKRGRNTC